MDRLSLCLPIYIRGRPFPRGPPPFLNMTKPCHGNAWGGREGEGLAGHPQPWGHELGRTVPESQDPLLPNKRHVAMESKHP